METKSHAGGIVGLHLKCAKGNWTLGGEPLDTGPDGFRFVAIPATARWGRIKWVDGLPVDQATQLYSDGCPGHGELPDGWDAYTSMQGITSDSEEVLTFTSAYGGRATIKNLLGQYEFHRRRKFPVCALATRPRGDEFGNVDPLLRIVGWVSTSDFAGILPPELIEAPAIEAKPAAPAIEHKAPAGAESEAGARPFAPVDIDGDDIPFVMEWR